MPPPPKQPWFNSLLPQIPPLRPPPSPSKTEEGPTVVVRSATRKGAGQGRHIDARSCHNKVTLYTNYEESSEIRRWCLRKKVPVSSLRDVILAYIRAHP